MSGIYIHIPFCKQACHYCDFHFSTSLKHKDALIQTILQEIKQREKNWKTHRFDSIYFGGGTPSILNVKELESILQAIYNNFHISNNVEITLEGNPDDLSIDKLTQFKTLGINRLSIGIQSFFEEDLVKLNRSHHANQATEAIKNAQKAGFNNITIDLIYGIPELTDTKWEQNIQTVLQYNIPHISAYALTIEPKTALAWQIKNGKYPPVSEEQAARQFDILRKKLAEHNYIQYEISNFGKESFFSRHNTSYWQNKAYLGLGPAAHSYNGQQRRWNIANNIKYIKEMGTGKYFEVERLTKNDIYNEIIMTGLRTIWGVDLNRIEALGSNYMEQLKNTTKSYLRNNQLILEDHFLKAHPDSLFLIEGIISDLFIV